MKMVKPMLVVVVGLGLGFVNPLVMAAQTNVETARNTPTEGQAPATPASEKECIQRTVVPSQQKIYGEIEPANLRWARPLMGSHRPSPEALAEAKAVCQAGHRPSKHRPM